MTLLNIATAYYMMLGRLILTKMMIAMIKKILVFLKAIHCSFRIIIKAINSQNARFMNQTSPPIKMNWLISLRTK